MSLLAAAIFDPMAERVAALSRWHTWAGAVEGAALGMCLCRLLPRVVAACPQFTEEPQRRDVAGPDQPPNPQDSSDAWHVYRDKKTKQCVAFVTHEATSMLLAMAAVCSEPCSSRTVLVATLRTC